MYFTSVHGKQYFLEFNLTPKIQQPKTLKRGKQ